MSSKYTKQIILVLGNDTNVGISAQSIQQNFPWYLDDAASPVISLTDQVINFSIILNSLRLFVLKPNERLRICIIGHCRAGQDYLQGYTRLGENVNTLQYTPDAFTSIIEFILKNINRDKKLPLTLSLISCYGGQDSSRFFFFKSKSFGERLHESLATKNIYAEVVARSRIVSIKPGTKHKLTKVDGRSATFFFAYIMLGVRDNLSYLISKYKTLDAINKLSTQPKSAIKNPIATCLRYLLADECIALDFKYDLHRLNPLSYFVPYFQQQKQQLRNQFLIKWYFANISNYHSLPDNSPFQMSTQANSKVLFTYNTSSDFYGKSPVRVKYPDAYAPEAVAARLNYYKHNFEENSVTPCTRLQFPAYLEDHFTDYMQTLHNWSKKKTVDNKEQVKNLRQLRTLLWIFNHDPNKKFLEPGFTEPKPQWSRDTIVKSISQSRFISKGK